MLHVLKAAEARLAELLQNEASWLTVDVDYHPPRVERLWQQWGEYRISLHRIHPCRPEEALFHPHPWPTAMRIVSGVYNMGVGHGPGIDPPPVDKALQMSAGSVYEMVDRDDWHYVQPVGDVALTVMVSGAPWQREMPIRPPKLNPLKEAQKREILDFFRRKYFPESSRRN